MTGSTRHRFIAASGACLLLAATTAMAQSGAAERRAMREQGAKATDTLAPSSLPAEQANQCVRFRVLHGGEEGHRKQGWYAYNDCAYRVNLAWCPMTASKTKSCVETAVGPGWSLRISPFTDTARYRSQACYAPKRPIASGEVNPFSGTRTLVCRE